MKPTDNPYKYEGQDCDPTPDREVHHAPDPKSEMERAARLEFAAAWNAAARMVTVFDEDGCASQALRVPDDWTHEGCRTELALMILRCPHLAEEKAQRDAEADSSRQLAEAFEQSEKPLADAGRRERVKALPKNVQRELPKWLRRMAI